MRAVLLCCVVGCVGASAGLRFPDFLAEPGQPEDAVGLCEPARGLIRYSEPPVVTTCLEDAQELNVIGWTGRPLLLLRSGDGMVQVRTPEELSAAVAPITSASAAVGYLFAAWRWQTGRLVDLRIENGVLVMRERLESYPPTIEAEGTGFTIRWPLIQMPAGGCQQDLYMVTVHVRRDGTMSELEREMVVEALTRICY